MAERDPTLLSTQSAKSELRPDEVASRVYGAELRRTFANQRRFLDDRHGVLQRREEVVFWGMLTAAILTLAFLVVGGALMMTQDLAGGIVSAIVGLFAGSGTLGLRRMGADLVEQRRAVEGQIADRSEKVNRANYALMIRDVEKRDDVLADLALDQPGSPDMLSPARQRRVLEP